MFGKGSIEGVAASDTASSATLGGSLTTTMALGIPAKIRADAVDPDRMIRPGMLSYVERGAWYRKQLRRLD